MTEEVKEEIEQEEVEIEETEAEAEDGLQEEQQGEEETDAEEDSEEQEEVDEVVVTIGDDEPEEKEAAPQWVKDVRKENKRLKQEMKELQKNAPTTDAIVVGAKPKMADDGIDFDEEIFEQRLDEWKDRKRQSEAAVETEENTKKEQAKEWETKLTDYTDSKKELGVDNFDESEEVVKDLLNENQQGVILIVANNPAKVVYALGNNPKKAAEIAAIKDPLKLAAAIAILEGSIKMGKRTPKTKPEKVVKGTAGAATGTYEKTLERLEKEADKSGDRSKIVRFKKEQKNKA